MEAVLVRIKQLKLGLRFKQTIGTIHKVKILLKFNNLPHLFIYTPCFLLHKKRLCAVVLNITTGLKMVNCRLT